MIHRIVLTAFTLFAVLTSIEGCSDMGTTPPQVSTAPQISSLLPDSASAGDTLRILGTNFGSSRGTSSVSVGSANTDTIYAWSTSEIRVKIPASASSGKVVVTVGGVSSNMASFALKGTSVTQISFSGDVLPVFRSAGCTGCHGGTNNLFVDTYAHLMTGTSNHGPVVTIGNGEGSLIIMKLRGTAAFGNRMPLSGPPYLDNATINKISAWITQGAKNN